MTRVGVEWIKTWQVATGLGSVLLGSLVAWVAWRDSPEAGGWVVAGTFLVASVLVPALWYRDLWRRRHVIINSRLVRRLRVRHGDLPLDLEALATVVDVTAAGLTAWMSTTSTPDLLDDLEIHVTDYSLRNHLGQRVAGLAKRNWVQVEYLDGDRTPPVWQLALVHELAHVWLHRHNLDPDYPHQGSIWDEVIEIENRL